MTTTSDNKTILSNIDLVGELPTPQTSIKKTIRDTDEDLNEFSLLLDSITTIDEKLKMLWKQIYRNSLEDRRNAHLIWLDLYTIVFGNPEQHVIHGDHLSKYLERMEKANAQLLKLAELVYKAKEKQEAEELPSSGNLFQQLKSNMRG